MVDFTSATSLMTVPSNAFEGASGLSACTKRRIIELHDGDHSPRAIPLFKDKPFDDWRTGCPCRNKKFVATESGDSDLR